MAFIILPGTHPGTDDIRYDIGDENAGSGNYDSFLRLQSHGTEDGFNTDDGHQADNKEGVFTHSIKFSDMQTVVIDGVEYYELRLDLNETDVDIDLTELRLFYSANPADGGDYDNDFIDLEEVFNLTGTIDLEDLHSGSGSDDYVFLVPTSLFADKSGYFTLYSEFTGAEGGFEEWRVLANEIGEDGLPAIHLEKTAAPEHFNEGTPTDVTFTYTLTSQSSSTDPLQITSFFDDNATPDDPSDDIDLLDGQTDPTLSKYYVDGDENGNGLLDSDETWTFSVTIKGLDFNAGTTRTNVAQVFADDDEGNSVSDSDDAIVTVDDVDPEITLVKEALVETIPEGTPTNVTYSYTLTNTSTSPFDPLTVTSLVDDLADGDATNDVELITGVDDTHPLGIYYVSGDDGDELLEQGESWVFNYTVNGVVLNAGETRTNIATVTAKDDEDNIVDDDDDAVVTGEDVDPTMNIEKVASLTQVQAGADTLVTFTYTVTNTSPASTDPITITYLVDDMGTPEIGDDQVLFTGDSTLGKGVYYDSGDGNNNGLLDKGESWVYKFTTTVNLDAGETRTNVVTVNGLDDEDNSVSDTDDASITAYNLGRTPGFWSNNGAKLWDGSAATMPRGGDLGINLGAAGDLLRRVEDMDLDGDDDTPGNPNNGTPGYLLIGDWDRDGIADANENVLLITREDALAMLNASMKQQQDARWVLARDVIASWLNYLGGSYVGDPNDADADSVVYHIDQAVAWLIESTVDENNVLTKAEITTNASTSWQKVGTNSGFWQNGYDINGGGITAPVPVDGQHDYGDVANLDIIGGSTLHSALDHYNNFGFI